MHVILPMYLIHKNDVINDVINDVNSSITKVKQHKQGVYKVSGQNVDGQNVDNFGNIDQNVDSQNVDGKKNITVIDKTQPYISLFTLSTLTCIQSIHNPNTLYNTHFLFSAQSLT